jgi:hypothetical protein
VAKETAQEIRTTAKETQQEAAPKTTQTASRDVDTLKEKKTQQAAAARKTKGKLKKRKLKSQGA